MFAVLQVFLLASVISINQPGIQAEAVTSKLVAPQIIVVPQLPPGDEATLAYSYFPVLLKLALDKTVATHGPYQFERTKVYLADNRLKQALRLGQVDVLWSSTTPEFEKMLLPVPVSLLTQLGNYRILVIRAGEQARFDGIKTLDDLRQFTGGMGSQWADLDVMLANDLPVVTAVGYERLFKMLSAKRFDYYSRGLYQVMSEVRARPELVMEKNLMLHYPAPYYFFVNRSNSALAERIETGLKIAMADGSFDQLFYSIPRHKWAQEEFDKGHRRIFKLDVPSAAAE